MIKAKNLLVSFDNIWTGCEVLAVDNNSSELVPEVKSIAEIRNEGSSESLRVRFNILSFMNSIHKVDKIRLVLQIASELGFQEVIQTLEEYEEELEEESTPIVKLSKEDYLNRSLYHYDRYGSEINAEDI